MRTNLSIQTLIVGLALACQADAQTQSFAVLPCAERRESPRTRPAAALSDTGRYIAFESAAALVAADRNTETDIYLLDRETGALTLVSRTAAGEAGRFESLAPSISGDGSLVAFESASPDLVGDDANLTQDVFVFDARTARMTLMSRTAKGHAADGRSGSPGVSGDGRYVVFDSEATNLLDGDTGQGNIRVYRHELSTARVERIADGHDPAISDDGQVIAYVASTAADGGRRKEIRVFADGRSWKMAQPEHGVADGASYAPRLSGDGQWLVYVSRATNLRAHAASGRGQIYREPVQGGAKLLVSAMADGAEANGFAGLPSINRDGTRVVFHSTATNIGCKGRRGLCADDINLVADVFLWDAAAPAVVRVNAPTAGVLWLDPSEAAVISPDGRRVAFQSRHPVGPDDGRDDFDLFLVSQ